MARRKRVKKEMEKADIPKEDSQEETPIIAADTPVEVESEYIVITSKVGISYPVTVESYNRNKDAWAKDGFIKEVDIKKARAVMAQAEAKAKALFKLN